jgi:integrase
MAQNNDVHLAPTRYTRTDFTALRAYLNRLPVSQISDLYYPEDELVALGCTTTPQLAARLETLLENLVRRATEHNPHLADLLKNARRSRTWSPKLVSFLGQAADQDMGRPYRHDAVSAWFKSRMTAALHAEQVRTLGDLMALIEVRGSGWWKPIRRLGAGKAGSIERWLDQHASTLGPLAMPEPSEPAGDLVVLAPQSRSLAPIERLLVPMALNGREGRNRNTDFCQITARHDYQAIDAYLTKFRHQEKTRRAYQKEIERFLLWCITVRGIALSSALQEDCEAYKDFLAHIPEDWVGPKCVRQDRRWRPFIGPLAPSSQRYAVQAVRFFFNWLVNVRYLGGNPWATVGDPPVAQAILALQIDKALPDTLWRKLTDPDGLLDQLCATPDSVLRERYRLRGRAAALSMAAQCRLARAALLLIGDTGIRREEAAYATRNHLKPIPDNAAIWELAVLGKRNKWRTVFPSKRAIDALDAHWGDRRSDFADGLAELPLLSPLCIPGTRNAKNKHLAESGELKESGFSPDGLYQLIKSLLQRMADDDRFDLTPSERAQLHRASTHALRHTFGTHAAAGDVPLDVIQKVLGHASLQTTTIYVQAEKKRSIAELGRFFKAE